MRYKRSVIRIIRYTKPSIIQSTPVNSYPDNSDLRLIRMYLRPPFREDQSNIIRVNRISHYSYYFIRSPVIELGGFHCTITRYKRNSVYDNTLSWPCSAKKEIKCWSKCPEKGAQNRSGDAFCFEAQRAKCTWCYSE